jgi:hypothetical protein
MATNTWQQILWLNPAKPPQRIDLGGPPPDLTLREWIDSTVARRREKTGMKRITNEPLLKLCKANRGNWFMIAADRARRLHQTSTNKKIKKRKL